MVGRHLWGSAGWLQLRGFLGTLSLDAGVRSPHADQGRWASW